MACGDAPVVLLDNPMALVEFRAPRRDVRVSLRRGDAPRACFDELKRAFQDMYSRVHESVVERGAPRIEVTFDLSRCGWIRGEYVSEWARLFRDNSLVTDAIVERSTIVLESPVMRAAVRAFMALYQTRRPVSIVAPDQRPNTSP